MKYTIEYTDTNTGRKVEAGLFPTDIRAFKWLRSHPEASNPELKAADDEKVKQFTNYWHVVKRVDL